MPEPHGEEYLENQVLAGILLNSSVYAFNFLSPCFQPVLGYVCEKPETVTSAVASKTIKTIK